MRLLPASAWHAPPASAAGPPPVSFHFSLPTVGRKETAPPIAFAACHGRLHQTVVLFSGRAGSGSRAPPVSCRPTRSAGSPSRPLEKTSLEIKNSRIQAGGVLPRPRRPGRSPCCVRCLQLRRFLGSPLTSHWGGSGCCVTRLRLRRFLDTTGEGNGEHSLLTARFVMERAREPGRCGTGCRSGRSAPGRTSTRPGEGR
jgi:hypothetical protein